MHQQDAMVRRWAEKLSRKLDEIVPSRPTETDFRQPMDQLLGEFCAEAGVNPLSHAEYTLATGRADAVFNRFVIEYERPGTLRPSLDDRQTEHAVEQVKSYIQGLAPRQRQDIRRIAGVAFDGCYIVFVRWREGDFAVENPVRVNQQSLERMLTWLSSLASGIALTAENLNRDFSTEQLRTQTILRALTEGLERSLERYPEGMVGKLFEQWRLFFSESIDYAEAFGGRKLEPLQKWTRKAGMEARTPTEAERFFFALHTYFALLVKLLAWLAVSRHMAVRLGAPAFGELLSAEGEALRQHLSDMESGGIFRKYGIANLLEGDFFAWYLYAWNDRIEQAVREILKRLDEYDPATLTVLPEETRDLFKQLYHYLLPREIRHNLGEYYTPDWLASRLLTQVDSEFFTADPQGSERRLRGKLLGGNGRGPLRWLDPACGSGTFLVLIIARMRELGTALMVNETELLSAILQNVVGFDLNPLAVLTARVNYLLAIADLLEHRKGEITIPVYLADSVRTPTMGRDLYTHGTYEFPTAVGILRVPDAVCTKDRFDRFCGVLEDSIRCELSRDAFVSRVRDFAPDAKEDVLKELYEQLLDLHRRGVDGLWARLLKNNFAPLTVGQFDYIVGNPPWVNWENLPDKYRDSIKDLWLRYGIAGTFKGGRPRLGAVKVDISALMTYTVMDALLRKGGRLGFVITQSLFKTAGAGAGFRRLRIPLPDGDAGSQRAVPLRVVHVDDMVALQPFEGATNRTTVMVLEKGRETKYPVPYTVWRKDKGRRFSYDSTLEEVTAATKRLNFVAEPVDAKDPTSPWITARPKALRAVRKVLGGGDPADRPYAAHAGAYTGGANAVYWVEIVTKRPDGLVVVRNITEGAKIKVDEVVEPIEPDLLYPLLRGRDVRRWQAEPSAWIIVPRDQGQADRVIGESVMQTQYARTYGYLRRFLDVLSRRRDAMVRSANERGEPFYFYSAVGNYTFAPWKVVWREQASTITASVIGVIDGKPVVPDHKLMLVDCQDQEGALYVCAVLNSAVASFVAASYAVEIQMDPHILEHIRIPRCDPSNAVHRRLAELSQQAHEAARREDAPALRGIEAEIDQQAAQLWGLTDDELREIQRSLAELAGP